MDSLITQVIAWPTLLMALVIFGFAPGAVLRLIVLAFRRDDPRRTELLAELPHVPRIERPFWVCEQLEVAVFEGLFRRLAGSASGLRRADDSDIRPTTQLLQVAAAEIMGQKQLVLHAEQQHAYELVLHTVDRTHQPDDTTVVIVTGGPGSGKSALGLALLGELSRQGRPVLHATGSRSFTQTLRKVAGKGSSRQYLFKYFNQFSEADQNGLDVLILDEAHRIRETSANRYTRQQFRSGRPQIDELMSAARVPVFLLDEHQVVRPGEIGTVEEIRRHAAAKGLAVHQVQLDTQFRGGASHKYEEWVLDLLGLSGKQPATWTGDDHFEVSVARSPYELEAVLTNRLAAGHSARMAAGYCWPWSGPRPDGSLAPDVVMGDWSRPWNLRGDRSVGGAPSAALWATDPAGFGQVGCIYTAQGFEYDWNGVIIGPDLVWRDGSWIAIRDANKDPDFRSRARVTDHEFGRLVRNVYKVLLTRGMVGTVIYSPDPETQSFLASLAPACNFSLRRNGSSKTWRKSRRAVPAATASP